MRMLIALLLAPVAVSFAQLSSAVSLSNGVQLTISTTATILGAQLQPASGNSFYHIFLPACDTESVFSNFTSGVPDENSKSP